MVRLRDVDILDSVVLHVKTHEFKFKEGNSPISIITRFAYKSMTTRWIWSTLIPVLGVYGIKATRKEVRFCFKFLR